MIIFKKTCETKISLVNRNFWIAQFQSNWTQNKLEQKKKYFSKLNSTNEETKLEVNKKKIHIKTTVP